METMTQKSYTLTKRIAKQGKQAILVIPKLLQEALKPGTIVKVTLDIIGG
jgi:sporulation-control protein spo0M